MQVMGETEAFRSSGKVAAVAAASSLKNKSADHGAVGVSELSASLCSDAAPSARCVGYARTSSASNVGADKDSEVRQRAAIDAYAARAGLHIEELFSDPAVSGADPVETRPGFASLLSYIEASGIKLVIVEDASRLARSVLAGELAVALLVKRGVRVLASNGDDLTATDDPMRVALRQMAAVFSEAEKRRLVLKLKHARDAKRAATGRCEGRPRPATEIIAAVKELGSQGVAQRAIAAKLAERGFFSVSGKVLSAGQVGRMLAY